MCVCVCVCVCVCLASVWTQLQLVQIMSRFGGRSVLLLLLSVLFIQTPTSDLPVINLTSSSCVWTCCCSVQRNCCCGSAAMSTLTVHSGNVCEGLDIWWVPECIRLFLKWRVQVIEQSNAKNVKQNKPDFNLKLVFFSWDYRFWNY